MINKVVYPGSFDPITKGHEEIIERCSKLFDEVTVLIAINSSKDYIFSLKEREELLKKVVKKYKNVKVDSFNGLIIDYCKEHHLTTIIKGLRNSKDLELELSQDYYNKLMDENIETICLLSSHENILISSSAIKELAHFHKSYDLYIPEEIREDIKKKLG